MIDLLNDVSRLCRLCRLHSSSYTELTVSRLLLLLLLAATAVMSFRSPADSSPCDLLLLEASLHCNRWSSEKRRLTVVSRSSPVVRDFATILLLSTVFANSHRFLLRA